MQENIYDPEYVKGLFNRMCGSYERMNFITSFGFSIRWRRQFLYKIKPLSEEVEIIDLLTGMGETWNGVRTVFPNSNLTALDFSEEMLINAKNRKHFENKINIIQQDVLENTLPSNHYDIVISAFGLKTFNDVQLRALASETKRILKDGGQFSFIEVSRPEHTILKWFYGFYLGKVIPILGKVFLGNPAEYKMLSRYTAEFENAKNVSHIFRNEGLSVTFNSYFFGCSSGFSGHK
jgi:ubiquinone/menaquinone biosynthesis methyltransferase